MQSYREYANIKIIEFKNELKSLKLSNFSSEHLFCQQCNELLNNQRTEFNLLIYKKKYGLVSISEYIDCMQIYSDAQIFMQNHLNDCLSEF